MQIQGTFVAKSIWKAWEVVKPCLHWVGEGFKDGLSMNQHNLWWTPLFSIHGVPLAKVHGTSALHFFKYGIITPKDLFSRVTMRLRL